MGLKLESPLLHEWASFTMKGDSDMLKISRTKALAKALVEDVQQLSQAWKSNRKKVSTFSTAGWGTDTAVAVFKNVNQQYSHL